MLFQKLNRSDAEKVFGIFQNAETNTAPANTPVCLDLSTAVNGVRVKKPATAELNAFVGIVDADIAASAYGLVQLYGYRSAGQIYVSDTEATAGHAAVPVNGQFYASINNTTGKHIVICESKAAGTATHNLKIHIRAM
jgi:hypothetical protein